MSLWVGVWVSIWTVFSSEPKDWQGQLCPETEGLMNAYKVHFLTRSGETRGNTAAKLLISDLLMTKAN